MWWLLVGGGVEKGALVLLLTCGYGSEKDRLREGDSAFESSATCSFKYFGHILRESIPHQHTKGKNIWKIPAY